MMGKRRTQSRGSGVNPHRMKGFMLAIERADELVDEYPEIADDYRRGYTLSQLAQE